MKLTLTEQKRLIAEQDMVCEAWQLFWNLERPIDYKGVDFSDMRLFFNARKGRIAKGDRYLYLLFVDSDGEGLEFRCMEGMNKFMLQMDFYPAFISEALLSYRKQYRRRLTTAQQQIA